MLTIDYTDELENYFLLIFKVEGIPCAGMVDKETHEVIDLFLLTSGVYNGSHPYNKDTSLKEVDWLPINYFNLEDDIKKYFNETY